MKKKIAVTVTCIMMGVVLLVTTAFAGGIGNSGYEAYKETLKKSFTNNNFTTKIAATITDNGSVLAEANANIKTNNETMSSITSLKAKSMERVMETYTGADKTVIKDSQTAEYMVVEHDKYNKNHYNKHFEGEYKYEDSKAGEAVLDALVGNMKNYFSLDEKSDGSKDIAFELSRTQMPAVVNAVAALGVREAGRGDYRNHNHYSPLNNEIKFEDLGLPKLVDDIRIDNFDVKAHVTAADVLESQTIAMTVYGKDSAGQAHEVIITLDMSFTDQGNTTPETIDLTAKQVKVIEPKDFE